LVFVELNCWFLVVGLRACDPRLNVAAIPFLFFGSWE